MARVSKVIQVKCPECGDNIVYVKVGKRTVCCTPKFVHAITMTGEKIDVLLYHAATCGHEAPAKPKRQRKAKQAGNAQDAQPTAEV